MEDHPRDSRGNVTYHAYTCPAYKAPLCTPLPEDSEEGWYCYIGPRPFFSNEA